MQRFLFHPHLARSLYCTGALLFALVFLKNAWVSDDAFILFRSLEQLLDGHGPRWNPQERVQVFTCPLWYWLLAGMGLVSRDHYLNSILLSAVCSGLLLWNLHHILRSAWRWLLAVILLAFSQAFFDFTTSGLENALAYCLLSFAVRFYLRSEQRDETHTSTDNLLYCGTACGLLLVARHDLLLLVLPLALHALWRARAHHIAITPALLALLSPLAVWTLFSLIYYGFPFPNTAYAKLGTWVSRELLLERGWIYFRTSITRDFLSVALLPAGMLAGLLSRHTALRMLSAGVALHISYVVWIGGDFMRGRFFSWDVLLCVILLLYPRAGWRAWQNAVVAVLGTLGIAVSSWLWQPPPLTPLQWGAAPFRMPDSADGVTQERYFYYWFTAFWKYWQRDTPLLHDHGWCQDSLEQQRQGRHVASAHTVGFRGYCLGTNDIVIDMLGITDPLLARMPHNTTQKNWRPGHFLRLAPAGYCTSVAEQQNRIADPDTAAYYDALRVLTASTPLLSAERLLTIWRMNTGYYDASLQHIQQRLSETATEQPDHQTQALQDCPAIDLPADVIERLRQAGK